MQNSVWLRTSRFYLIFLLDIVQSFPLLSYCIVSPIYISSIYNVEIRFIISEEIIKLGILYFSLFTWYQSQERKPNFFFWVIVFHSDLLLRRRISISPPQPPSAAGVTAAGDFPGSSSPAENHRFRSAEGRSTRRWPPRRKPASHAPSPACLLRQLAFHAPARACACGRVAPSPVTGLHSQGRPAPSWCSSPPAVHSEHFFSTFCPFLPPPLVPLPWLRFIFSRFSSSLVGFSSSSVVFSTVWVPFFFIFKLHSCDSPSY